MLSSETRVTWTQADLITELATGWGAYAAWTCRTKGCGGDGAGQLQISSRYSEPVDYSFLKFSV